MVHETTEKIEKSFAYIRVSTDIQEKKLTQENQEIVIKRYAKQHNIEIVSWFFDAMQGVINDRPQFTEMMNRINEVDSVVLFDTSRWSRDFEYSVGLIFQFKNLGKGVHIAVENLKLNLNDDMAQLIQIIKSWFNAHERKKIKQRQKIGIERYKMKHGRWGPRKKKLDVKKYNFLREAGVSKAAIARLLKMSKTTLNCRLKELGIDY